MLSIGHSHGIHKYSIEQNYIIHYKFPIYKPNIMSSVITVKGYRTCRM